MKLNRKWFLVIALVLSTTMAIGGTLAYLTDRDSAANVLTFGNVDIELNEDFSQGSELIPGVNIEKAPTITNTGKNDAWVWATIAIPSALDNEDASANVVHFNMSKESVGEGYWNWTDESGNYVVDTMEKDDVEYNVYTVLYGTALSAGEATAHPVIYKVYMDPHVDIDPEGNLNHVEAGVANEIDWNITEDGNPVIYVSAYAMQTDGFATVQDAYAAYTAQWTTTDGVNNGIEWGTPSENTAEGEEINQALAAGVPVTLPESVEGNISVPANGGSDLNLNENTLTGSINNAGDLKVSGGAIENDAFGIQNSGEMTVEGVDINAGSSADYAVIARGGTLEMSDSDVISAGGGIGARGGKVVFDGGKVYVDSDSTAGRYVFYAAGEGTVIEIYDGEFGWDKNDNQKRAYIYAEAGAEVYVKGGTFGKASTRSGYTAGILGEGKVVITGGTFGFDPSEWVADGYEAVKNGTTWTVSEK